MKMPETIRVGLHSEDASFVNPSELSDTEKHWLCVTDSDRLNGFVAEYRFVRMLKVTTETKTITTVEEVQ